jgi:N12 class adenine-specific DNA methylase
MQPAAVQGQDKALENHQLPADQDWIPRGNKSKARTNLDVLRLLNDLESEGRSPTVAEQHLLRQYTGWGGLKPAVDLQKARRAQHLKYQYGDQLAATLRWIEEWQEIHNQISEALTEDAMEQAYESSEYAHYTSRTVINAMWSAVERLGYRGGSALEPAVGVGHFVGLQPEGAGRCNTSWLLIDKDSTSARIARHLYPLADTREAGFEDIRVKPNSLDLAITNVPFSQSPVFDVGNKAYSRLSLHNYFIIRQLDLLKPGAIGAFITSSFTMDSLDPTPRRMMAERADLLGAIRLPNTAFKENAGTEVVADILFFRRKDDTAFVGHDFQHLHPTTSIEGYTEIPTNFPGNIEEWLELSDEERKKKIQWSNTKTAHNDGQRPIRVDDFRVNQYFVLHPHMVLGHLSLKGTQYNKCSMTVLPNESAALSDQLALAIEHLPQNVFAAQAQKSSSPILLAEHGARSRRLRIVDNVPMIPDDSGELVTPKWYTNAPNDIHRAELARQVTDYIALRDAVEDLVQAEASGSETGERRAKLDRIYTDYVMSWGNVRDAARNSILHVDRDFPIVGALEHMRPATEAEIRMMHPLFAPHQIKELLAKFAAGRKSFWIYEKMPIFREPTVRPVERPVQAASLKDALDISDNWTGRVDLDYMAQLLGETPPIIADLLRSTGLAYENPRTGAWEVAEIYLSGFVVEKLKEAQIAAQQDPIYQANVEALEAVQPERVPLERIIRPEDPGDAPQIGSRWIPGHIYEAFAEETFGVSVQVQYIEKIGTFAIKWASPRTNLKWQNLKNTDTWGVQYSEDVHRNGLARTGVELFERALSLRSPVIEWTEEEMRYTDPKATEAATEKIALMNEEFIRYIEKYPSVGNQLEEVFNRIFTISRRTRYPVPSIAYYPGMAPSITMPDGRSEPLIPKDHQKVVAYRAVRNSLMIAHGVGFGKTLAAIMILMELRRLGLAKKPMLAVMNATLQQIVNDIKRFYPEARVHAPGAQMEGPLDRRIFMAQTVMSDWDIVLIPHSMLNMIPNDPQRERDWITDEIDDLVSTIETERDQHGKDAPAISELNKVVNTLKVKLKELLHRKKDDSLTFEQLGIDALIVDESHQYKKLPFRSSLASGRSGVKGIDQGKSTGWGPNLLLKMRHVQQRNRGKNTAMMTGTPITNTIAEVWTIMRYLRPDVLEKFGMSTFDAFQTSFTVIKTEPERTATGAVKPVSRLTRFRFVQKLMDAWLEVADAKFNAADAGIKQPALKDGEPRSVAIPPTEELREFTQYLAWKFDAWRNMGAAEIKRNNFQAIPAKIAQWAKIGAMDMRYINPELPDNPDSKLNRALDRVKEIYDETTNMRLLDGTLPTTPRHGTQFLFSDQIASVDGTINIYHDIKKRLIKRGIPAREILIAHPTGGVTKKNRQQHIDKLQLGIYRIAIGHTASLGTGVNAQDLAAALHHLDAPWMPKDIEQREGRVIRQGNLVWDQHGRQVEVNRWLAHTSFDGTLWGILSAKAGMVGQAIDGSYEGDTMSDAGERVTASYTQAKAAATGDTRFIDKETYERQIQRLENARDTFLKGRRNAHKQVETLESTIPKMEANLVRDRQLASDYALLFSEEDTITLEVQGQLHKGKKAATEALDRLIAERVQRWPFTYAEADALGWQPSFHRNLYSDTGYATEYTYDRPAGMITLNGKPVALTEVVVVRDRAEAWTKGVQRSISEFQFRFVEDAILEKRAGTFNTAAGLFISLRTVLKGIQEAPREMDLLLDQKRKDLATAKENLGGTFAKEEELAVLREALARVEKSLAEDPEPVITEPTLRFYDIFVRSEDLKQAAMERLRARGEEVSLTEDIDDAEEDGDDEPESNGIDPFADMETPCVPVSVPKPKPAQNSAPLYYPKDLFELMGEMAA